MCRRFGGFVLQPGTELRPPRPGLRARRVSRLRLAGVLSALTPPFVPPGLRPARAARQGVGDRRGRDGPAGGRLSVAGAGGAGVRRCLRPAGSPDAGVGDAGRVGRGGETGRGEPRAARRSFRPRRLALPRPALRGGAADDAKPRRRRRSGSGNLRQGLCRLPPVRGRHQPQGLAVPNPDQCVHQHLSADASVSPRRARPNRSRTGSWPPPSRTRPPGSKAPKWKRSSTSRTATSRMPCRISPRSSAWPSTSPTSRASPTRRSRTSWAPRSGRSCPACIAAGAACAEPSRGTRLTAASSALRTSKATAAQRGPVPGQ